MSSFFAGNDLLIGLAKQADKDTPAGSPTMALRVYEWSKDPVRVQAPLEETDSSIQQGATHVTAIAPGFSFGVYGRPSELDLIAYGLLGDNADGASLGVVEHTATPEDALVQPYFTVWQCEPYACTKFDGCKIGAATFQAQDQGQTELRVTGIQWQAMGVTHGEAEPAGIADLLQDEAPFIYAEAAIRYAGVHPGLTTAFSWTVNRNLQRIQGDGGFRATDLIGGKLQSDGSITRYVQSDDILRAVDTGTAAGTEPTSTIYEESVEILFDRDTPERAFVIRSDGISYETREVAIDPANGSPYQEVLGFRTQPQVDIADNLQIVTLNSYATPTTVRS